MNETDKFDFDLLGPSGLICCGPLSTDFNGTLVFI